MSDENGELPADPGSLSRRRVLQGMGMGAVATVAGCLGGGGGQCRDLRTDLSTGTTNFSVDAVGTTDTDWRVVSSPDGTTGQATSIGPVSTWATSPSANWIDPYGTGGVPATSDPVGEYVYEVDFEVPNDWGNGQCELRVQEWTADDEATLELEGTSGTTTLDQISGPLGAHPTLHGPVTQSVSPGQYTLRARVENTQTITGLLVYADVFCDCDAPVDDPCALSIEKEFTGGTVTHGGTAEFEITVCNEGDGVCEDPVTVTDDLPPGTFVSSLSGSGWSSTASAGVVSFQHANAGGLDSGDCLPTLALTLNVGSAGDVGEALLNCATVERGDPNQTDARDCASVPIDQPPGACDLAITKSHSGDLVAPGDTTTFEIGVCNVGDGDCSGLVSVVDALPSTLTFVSASGNGWTCTESGGTVTCDHLNGGGLAPSDCLPTLTLEVELGSAGEVGDAVTNCARLVSDDANATNDRDCATVPVDTDPAASKCDLAVTKTHDGETVTEGASTTFEVEVCNVGGGACDGPVTVVDALPAGVSFDAASGSGWSCTQSGNSLVCTHANAGGLAAGACLPTLSLAVTVGPIAETGDEVRNCVRIDGSDVNPANDRDCVRVPVRPGEGKCDLAVTKTHAGDVATAGGTTTFEVEVCNDGDGLCGDPVTVVDDLPAGTSFVAGTGTGWSVTHTGGTVVAAHANPGGLPPGDCLPTLTIEVELGSIDETGDQIRNCVRIKGEDANPDNDRDCVTVPVEDAQGNACEGLSVEKSVHRRLTFGGQGSFVVEVCNLVEETCNGEITVTDTLTQDGVSLTGGAGNGWSVSVSGDTVTAVHQNAGGLTAGACLPPLTLDVAVGSTDEVTQDVVENCVAVSVDGTLVDDDCVTAQITDK